MIQEPKPLSLRQDSWDLSHSRNPMELVPALWEAPSWHSGRIKTDMPLRLDNVCAGTEWWNQYDILLCMADGNDMKPSDQEQAEQLRTLIQSGNIEKVTQALRDMSLDERLAVLKAYPGGTTEVDGYTVHALERDLVLHLGTKRGYSLWLNTVLAGSSKQQGAQVRKWMLQDPTVFEKRKAGDGKLKDVEWEISQGKKHAIQQLLSTLQIAKQSDLDKFPLPGKFEKFGQTHFPDRYYTADMVQVFAPAKNRQDYDLIAGLNNPDKPVKQPVKAQEQPKADEPKPMPAVNTERPGTPLPVQQDDAQKTVLAKAANLKKLIEAKDPAEVKSALDDMSIAERQALLKLYPDGAPKIEDYTAHPLEKDLVLTLGSKQGYDLWLNHALAGMEDRQAAEMRKWLYEDKKAFDKRREKFPQLHGFDWQVSNGKKLAIQNLLKTKSIDKKSDLDLFPLPPDFIRFGEKYFKDRYYTSDFAPLYDTGGKKDYDLLAHWDKPPDFNTPAPQKTKPAPAVVADGKADPKQLAKEAAALVSKSKDDNSREMIALLDRLKPEQRAEFLKEFMALPQNAMFARSEEAYYGFWRCMTQRYGDKANDIFLNHMAKGLKDSKGQDVQTIALQHFLGKKGRFTTGELVALNNYRLSLSANEQQAFNTRYKGLGTRLASELNQQVRDLLAKKNTGDLKYLLSAMTPDQRKAFMREYAVANFILQEKDENASFASITLRAMKAKIGDDAYDIMLNHMVKGIQHQDGKDYQAHVLYQWMVRDKEAYEQHPRRNGHFAVTRGKVKAIRQFLLEKGIDSQATLDSIENEKTKPFFDYANDVWSFPGQLPSHLSNVHILTGNLANAPAELSYKPLFKPPPVEEEQPKRIDFRMFDNICIKGCHGGLPPGKSGGDSLGPWNNWGGLGRDPKERLPLLLDRKADPLLLLDPKRKSGKQPTPENLAAFLKELKDTRLSHNPDIPPEVLP